MYQLDTAILSLIDGQPDVGERGIEALLSTQNIFIPRSRLRMESLVLIQKVANIGRMLLVFKDVPYIT